MEVKGTESTTKSVKIETGVKSGLNVDSPNFQSPDVIPFNNGIFEQDNTENVEPRF